MKKSILTLLLLSLTYTELSIAQTCNSAIPADTANSRYILNTNGTALDKKTGLTWMRCALGQTWSGTTCTGTAQAYYWHIALQTAENTVFAGVSDWRLPNKKELESLLERRCYDPMINLTAFPNEVGKSVWSSSPYALDSYNAWIVNFTYGNGYGGFKGYSYFVRLVRGGQ